MKTNPLQKNLSIFFLSFFFALSSVQYNYQEQYKYSSLDILFIPTDTPVECLVDPEQDSIRISKILSGFEYSNTNQTKKVFSNPYAHLYIFQYNFPQTQRINPQNLLVPPEVTLFHPFISVLHKSQPCHSSEDDNPFPINC